MGNIVNKGNRTLGFLKRNIRIDSQNLRSKACKAIARPTLEYATHIFYKELRSRLVGSFLNFWATLPPKVSDGFLISKCQKCRVNLAS